MTPAGTPSGYGQQATAFNREDGPKFPWLLPVDLDSVSLSSLFRSARLPAFLRCLATSSAQVRVLSLLRIFLTDLVVSNDCRLTKGDSTPTSRGVERSWYEIEITWVSWVGEGVRGGAPKVPGWVDVER